MWKLILFSILKILKPTVYFEYLSFCKENIGTQSSEKDQRVQFSSRLFFLFNPQGPDWVFLCLLLFYISSPHSIYLFWFRNYTTMLRATVLSESFLFLLVTFVQTSRLPSAFQPSVPNYFRPLCFLIFSSLGQAAWNQLHNILFDIKPHIYFTVSKFSGAIAVFLNYV